MTKAEERALEFLPSHPNEGIERQRKRFRGFYVDGYVQGQKDLAADPQETELNAEAYLTELGYTIIPPDAKFSPANVATLAKHLLVWAEQAPKDHDSGWEDYKREIIKGLLINVISEYCGLTSTTFTNRQYIMNAIRNAELVADIIVKELKEEEK